MKILRAELRIDQPFVKKPAVKRRRIPGKHFKQDIRLELFAQGALRRIVGLLEAEHEQRRGHIELFLNIRLHNLRRLVREIALNSELRRLFEDTVRHLEHFVNGHVARDGERHIIQVVKRVVAAIQKVGRDLRNRINGPCDINAHGMHLIERAQAVEHDLPVRLILVHPNFLPDNALLLLHGLLREIWRLHKVQKDLQRCLEIARTGKKVAGAFKRCVGIGGRARLRIAGEGVEILAFKELVLQKVRDSLRHLGKIRLVAALKTRVDRAVLRAEQRIGGGIPLLGHHEDR